MVKDSGKLAVMDQMLTRLIKDGHKVNIFKMFREFYLINILFIQVLIFSTLTMLLDVLADYLSMRGMKFCRLDGRMNLEDRATDMETFRNDPDTSVFLISTRAGGLGITLTSADTVIIYDSDWVRASRVVNFRQMTGVSSFSSNLSFFRFHNRILNAICKLKTDVTVSVRQDLSLFTAW